MTVDLGSTKSNIEILGSFYTFESNISDIHIAILEEYLRNPADLTDLGSQAGFLIKYVYFVEEIPETIVKKIEDKFIVFLDSSSLFAIYMAILKSRATKILTDVKEGKTEAEKQEIDKALDSLNNLNTDKSLAQRITELVGSNPDASDADIRKLLED